MSLEIWSTVAAVGTFLVIAVTAIAALAQLRHMGSRNQLEAVLSLNQEFRSQELQDALRFIQKDLPSKMEDPAFRAELGSRGFIDASVHQEMSACNWFNEMGTLVKHGLVDERTFLDLYGRLAAQYWDLLSPAIAILRRNRGSGQYQNFEYLAIRSRDWLARYPDGHFPGAISRLRTDDVWLVHDGQRPPK